MYINKKHLRKYIFIFIFIFITFNFGYALLNSELVISGKSTISKNTWDVHFENLKVKEGSINASVEPVVSSSTTISNFQLVLAKPGDYYEFTVDVVNAGTIDAMVENVVKEPDLTVEQAKYLNYIIEYENGEQIAKKHLIEQGMFVRVKVRIEYKKDITESELPTETSVLSLGFNINYVQSDGTGIFVEDLGAVALSLEELQRVFDFNYYSTFNLAVTDVNNATIGANSDANASNAVAGVYENHGKKYVVLLKDRTESTRIKPAVDMTINLGGNTFIANDKVGIDIVGGNVNIDGRLPGSTVYMTHTGTNNAKPVQVQAGAGYTSNIYGGKYISDAENATGGSIAVYSGTLNISDATVISTTVGGSAKGISISAGATTNIDNCEITSTSTTGKVWAVSASTGAQGNIKNSTFTSSTDSGDSALGLYVDGEYNIENSEFNVTGGGSLATSIETGSSANLTISNIKILTTATTGKGYGLVNLEGSTTTISNSEIRAHANYLLSETGTSNWTALSQGIASYGTITINNCYVLGTHTGMSIRGYANINGGTYESFGHGGIYFSGANSTSYVRNATIRESAMPDGFIATDVSNNAGLYIGGATNNNNNKIYMDNCDIYGSKQAIILRGSSGEQYNTLYISNSRINTNSIIRIDNDTHSLYLGVGNNFNSSITTNIARVFITSDTYILN